MVRVAMNWTQEIKKCEKGENEILGTLAASIAPREAVDRSLFAIAPRELQIHTISMTSPTVE